MIPEDILEMAGIHVIKSSIDVPHFRIVGNIGQRAMRFSRFQHAVLQSSLTDAITMARHVVAFDCGSPLRICSWSSGTLDRFDGVHGTALEVTSSEGSLQRYLLSSLTVKCMPQHLDWNEHHQSQLVQWIHSMDDYAEYRADAVLLELRYDQLAWAFKRLPMVMFSHVAGLIPCTPLSHSAWQRSETGLAPAIDPEHDSSFHEAGIGDLMDVVETTTSNNISAAMVKQALECLSVVQSEGPREHIHRWIQSLCALAPRLHTYSAHTALIVSWIADLVESGTSKKGAESDHLTRRRYALVAAPALFEAIKELPDHPQNWSKDMRIGAYTKAMVAASSSDKRALSAAIASFQIYLFDSFDIRPIRAELGQYVPESKPRAQCVFVHEVERASSWLDSAKMDDEHLRLRAQAALWMLFDAPFRINELLQLRKGNISKLAEGTYEVTILPARGDRLKTPAASRRVWVRLPQACAFLEKLIEQRDQDRWTSKELLFGRGVEGAVTYRKNLLRRVLLQVLKATTGDPAMTIHALRHAWACRALSEALGTSGCTNFRRISHIAAQMGHESAHTTLQNYFHLPEMPLRHHLDAELMLQIQWPSELAAPYVGLPAAALRKRASRAHQDIGELVWRLLIENSSSATPTHTDGEPMWTIPKPPPIEARGLTPLTPGLVMQLLLAHETSHHPLEVLSQRFGITLERGKTAIAHLNFVRSQILRSAYERKNPKPAQVDRQAPDLLIRKIQQFKYSEAVERLHDVPADACLLHLGVEAWTQLRNRYGYIHLAGDHTTFSFLALLATFGFRATDFIVVIAESDSSQNHRNDLLKRQLESVFLHAMVALPKIRENAPAHPKRPSAYLQWNPNVRQYKYSISRDLKGLDALMLVLAVFCRLSIQEVA